MLLNCGVREDSWESFGRARRSNQSILKEISPEYSLEGLMLKLKHQDFGHLMRRTDSLEKTLMLGKTEGRRRRGQQRLRWLDGITNLMDMDLRFGLWRKLSAEELMLLNCGVLEKTLESPLDCKEVQPVHPKGDQSWVFIGRTDAKAETAIFWPPHVKIWLIGKVPGADRNWGQEEKGMTEDEMSGWHHRLYGHGFE